MLNENQIKEALVGVIDPELGRNIVEAGMVREIEINDGHVRIVLALTKTDCPLKNYLQEKDPGNSCVSARSEKRPG
jgi:ATP-binding protein involved in chromosome partitioning